MPYSLKILFPFFMHQFRLKSLQNSSSMKTRVDSFCDYSEAALKTFLIERLPLASHGESFEEQSAPIKLFLVSLQCLKAFLQQSSSLLRPAVSPPLNLQQILPSQVSLTLISSSVNLKCSFRSGMNVRADFTDSSLLQNAGRSPFFGEDRTYLTLTPTYFFLMLP